MQTHPGFILSLQAFTVIIQYHSFLHFEPSYLLNFNFDADPDPALQNEADPDPDSQH
jgi:hypothetical protein